MLNDGLVARETTKEVLIGGKWIPYYCRGDDTDESREFYRDLDVTSFAQGSFTCKINGIVQSPSPEKIYYRKK